MSDTEEKALIARAELDRVIADAQAELDRVIEAALAQYKRAQEISAQEASHDGR
jgi:hypothetical protein